MTAAWTVKDSSGRLVNEYAGGSRIEVGCKLVPGHYDAFRLHVSSSYRELFERALGQVLARKGWEIVRFKAPAGGGRMTGEQHAATAA